ncbi:MAG: LysR family transcriptional regulator [Burkholderiales bacterium]|nr:LysR family transcriptional regulator [Burkholderiales bacterium]
MPESRSVLTPDALTMMDVIARTGSFAAAARELGKVPSSLTYSVRQLEEALDVLLFDRRSRQARLTAAGEELLNEGRRLLEQMDAVANRVKRVATGWETQLSIVVDGVVSRLTMFELCEAFYALESPTVAVRPAAGSNAPTHATPAGPGTRLRLRTEVMTGTWEALTSGQSDLAIGVGMERGLNSGIQMKELGVVPFVFTVAPHHPLARADAPISDTELMRHRAVAVADSAQRLAPLTVNLLPGQDVLTVGSMQLKIEALLRCMGCGFVPEPMARDHIAAGRLVVMPVQRAARAPALGYAWRAPTGDRAGAAREAHLGLALRWWLAQLERPATRAALLERHGQVPLAGM